MMTQQRKGRRQLAMWKKFAFATAMVLVALVSLFGLLEAGIRLLEATPLTHGDNRFPPFAVDWSWRLVDGLRLHPANSSFTHVNESGETVAIRNDGLGLRNDPDRTLDPGRPVVLVLGDSFVQAINTRFEQTMCRELERLLAPHGAQVVNAGVAGYSNNEELRLLQRIGDEVQPDAVVLMAYLGNDLRDNYRLMRARMLAEKAKAPPQMTSDLWFNATRWSRLLTAIERNKTSPVESLDETGFDLDSYFDFELLTLWNRPHPAVAAAEEETRRILGKMKAWCDERGIPLWVFTIPSKAQADRELRLIAWFERSPESAQKAMHVARSPEGVSFDRPDDIYARLCADLGIPCSSLTPLFRANNAQPLFYQIDDHWTPRAQRLTAELIAETLRPRLPAPEPPP